ncbi:hypothetical protein ACFV4F_14915 [Kitasatospora sp. NPDC059722]|uniref:hypothetical protein n=1 Tax=unclassified Kitasatospora TaxID=2633591 RepID=UPI00365C5198
MARRGGELEAFIAFLGGLLAVTPPALAMTVLHVLPRSEPSLRAAGMLTLGVVWLTVTVTLYLRLRARPDGRTR